MKNKKFVAKLRAAMQDNKIIRDSTPIDLTNCSNGLLLGILFTHLPAGDPEQATPRTFEDYIAELKALEKSTKVPTGWKIKLVQPEDDIRPTAHPGLDGVFYLELSRRGHPVGSISVVSLDSLHRYEVIHYATDGSWDGDSIDDAVDQLVTTQHEYIATKGRK